MKYATITLHDKTPWSEDFQDHYFSMHQGYEESLYVFLKHNDLPERFSSAQKSGLLIGETGFGTGLNFLTTLYHWDQYQTSKVPLEFISTELLPIKKNILAEIYNIYTQQWHFLKPYCQLLYDVYPASISSDISASFFNEQVTLKVFFSDATQALKKPELKTKLFDIWYLDGFAPSKNPDMWQSELYRCMADLSHASATFSTFTAAGKVRRELVANGFQVTKSPGFGSKREMLYGKKLI